MDPGVSFGELLNYTEEENRRWKQFLARHPEALDLPFDVAGDVRQLLVHIFAVELHFAHAITGKPAVNPEQLATRKLDEIFAIGEQAMQTYREFLALASPQDWAEKVELGRINMRASKRKLVAQALTHSLRHWAQLATFLRQQGLQQEWRHDFLLSQAME